MPATARYKAVALRRVVAGCSYQLRWPRLRKHTGRGASLTRFNTLLPMPVCFNHKGTGSVDGEHPRRKSARLSSSRHFVYILWCVCERPQACVPVDAGVGNYTRVFEAVQARSSMHGVAPSSSCTCLRLCCARLLTQLCKSCPVRRQLWPRSKQANKE